MSARTAVDRFMRRYIVAPDPDPQLSRLDCLDRLEHVSPAFPRRAMSALDVDLYAVTHNPALGTVEGILWEAEFRRDQWAASVTVTRNPALAVGYVLVLAGVVGYVLTMLVVPIMGVLS